MREEIMKEKYNLNERTLHGDNLAHQVQDADAYGVSNTLTAADLWNILDNIQTHFIDAGRDEEASLVGELMAQTMAKYPDIEV